VEGDADGDGTPDSKDEYPYNFNCAHGLCPEGLPSHDSQGIARDAGHEPKQGGNGTLKAGFKDADGDGIPDDMDPAPYDPTCPELPCPSFDCPGDCVDEQDTDGDGVPDSEDPAPRDHTCHDPSCVDSDGDGRPDAEDAAPYDPSCWEESCVRAGDADGDGVPDSEDPAPHNAMCWEGGCSSETEEAAKDSDRDGVSDLLDEAPFDPHCTEKLCVDSDGDGVVDTEDSMPYDPNCWDSASNCSKEGDMDGDGVPDVEDMAPYIHGAGAYQGRQPWEIIHHKYGPASIPTDSSDAVVGDKKIDWKSNMRANGPQYMGDWREEWPKAEETETESIARICQAHRNTAWCKKWFRRYR